MDDGDVIDRMITAWREQLPGLDPSPLAVVGRVIVLAQHLERSVGEALAAHSLSLGEFDILATLRRHGPKGGLSPELLEASCSPAGGMTARLDKLETAGLIERQQDPNRSPRSRGGTDCERPQDDRDRRGDALRGSRAINAAALRQESKTLANLLRKWLSQFPAA